MTALLQALTRMDSLDAIVGLDIAPRTVRSTIRHDAGGLRAFRKTDEGYYRADAYVAREGIYEYADGNGGIVRELVPSSTLHSRASLDTLRMKPVTDDHPHPLTYPNMVTMDNVKDLGRGTTGEDVAIADDGRVRFSVMVTDSRGIKAIDGGKKYVSPGYTCDVIYQPGEHPKYGKYDAIQVNRVYNHLALTASPRGGTGVCLRMDGLSANIDTDPKTETEPPEEANMLDELMKLHPGLSRQDAQKIIDDGPKLLEQAARLDSDDHKALVEKAGKFDALPDADAVKQARVDSRKERADLDTIALAHKLDAKDTVLLDNAELKSAILDAAKVEIPKVDGLTPAQSALFSWAGFKAAYKPDETNGTPRVDAAEQASYDSLGFPATAPASKGNEDFDFNLSGVLSRFDSTQAPDSASE